MKKLWFSSGALVGLTLISISSASVPRGSRVTDDTAIYQNLSEIRVAREHDLNFDADINRLSAIEGRYREHNLSRNPRLRGPLNRISQQQYRYQPRPSQAKAVRQ